MEKSTRIEEEIFDEAIRLEGAEAVNKLLDDRCGNNKALRYRIESLLKAHVEAERFFDVEGMGVRLSDTFARMKQQVQAPVAGMPLDGETQGRRIGRYKLIDKIGEGGCGAVYLAEQEEPVRRHVALKIIRLGMETRSVIARFEAEQQALAMMDHPNIAKVFDAGTTDDGLPFFVMEHVHGVRITDYCDQYQLPIPERLDLFVQVCHAIQHAHQKGIIHGDIKPSNIMVARHDGVPQPKVIDFGIAKATEPRLGKSFIWSTSALWMGTPAYMSPEQMDFGETDVDTRSDIYSLGVLLFELLTGRTPLERKLPADADLDTIQKIIQEHLLQKPSQCLSALDVNLLAVAARERRLKPKRLISALHGDLDCIVMKALAKDRRLRYETANALAIDVCRNMAHEPVLAHKGGWLYSFRKTLRRNSAVSIASAIVVVTLFVALGVSTRLFLKERDARQRAVAAEQQESRLRRDAELREKIIHAALLIKQGNYAEADSLLQHVTIDYPTLEGAAVFRSIGEWHALHGRWRSAMRCFSALLQINSLDDTDLRTLDILELGPVLVEMDDFGSYELFRQSLRVYLPEINAFADRIMKISLLLPADQALLDSLEGHAAQVVKDCEWATQNNHAFEAGWRSMVLALYEYRRNNYDDAVFWARKSLAYSDPNPPRIVTTKAILSMALFQIGTNGEARMQLQQAIALMKERLPSGVDRGTPVQGFWFDWAFARIIVREAESLLGTVEKR
ncbi:MAG: protein kinase [Opitutales bacterium]|nr:protein kinase [Opitutales bacterium]